MIDETVKALRGECKLRYAGINCEGCEFVGEKLAFPYYRCKLHKIAADQLEQLQAENERLKAGKPVRCEECKHSERYTDNFCKCNQFNGLKQYGDYCSYGERRE